MTRPVYFDETYFLNNFGASIVSGCLVEGGTSLTVTGSVLSDVISASCDYMDSAFDVAGFSCPLSSIDVGYPSIVKRAGAQIAMFYLYEKSGVQPTESLIFAVQSTDSWLDQVATGRRGIPGYNASGPGAVKGGHVMGSPSTNATVVADGGPWSIRRLKGTLF